MPLMESWNRPRSPLRSLCFPFRELLKWTWQWTREINMATWAIKGSSVRVPANATRMRSLAGTNHSPCRFCALFGGLLYTRMRVIEYSKRKVLICLWRSRGSIAFPEKKISNQRPIQTGQLFIIDCKTAYRWYQRSLLFLPILQLSAVANSANW